jgi:hypothetical protein
MSWHCYFFLYSYSYDITHTLQNNMSPPRNIIPAPSDDGNSGIVPQFKTSGNEVHYPVMFPFFTVFL